MKILIINNSSSENELNIVKGNLKKKFSYVGRINENNQGIFNKLIKSEISMYDYILVYEASFKTKIDFYFYLGYLKKFNLKGIYVKTHNGLEIKIEKITDLTVRK